MAAKKMFFRGALSFPMRVGAGGIRFDPARLEEYYRNNERGRGGWYPLGASQSWHDGIHLHVSHDEEPVRAIADGRMVAARLTENYDHGLHPFGSNCFVLIQHQLSLIDNPDQRRSWDTDTWQTRDVTFYSLYMHLDPRVFKLDEVPWLASYRPYLREGLSYSGEIWRIKKPDGGVRQVNVYSEPRPIDGKLARRPAIQQIAKRGDLVELLGDQTVEARQAGVHVSYRKIRLLDSANRCEGWIRVDGDRIEQTDACRVIRELQNGGVARLDCTVQAGDCVGHAGPLSPEGASGSAAAGGGIHLEIFSAENLVADPKENGWVVCDDDSDDDVICETRTLLESLKKQEPSLSQKLAAWWNSLFGPETTAARRDYEQALSIQDRALVRKIITRNTSFWAIDWNRMASRPENRAWRANFDITDAVVQAAQRYTWWRELAERANGILPGRTLVYHYHPLALMHYLWERVPRSPVFFIERKEQGEKVRYVVSTHRHLDKKGDKLWVYEHRYLDERSHPDERRLSTTMSYPFPAGDQQVPSGGSTVAGWYGIGEQGTPLLYDALLAHPHAGLASAVESCADNTDISQEDLKHSWAAIWHSEGGLNAFNTYDNGHLSVGALQQIAGPIYGSGTFKEQGELGAAMYAVKSAGAEGAELFRRYFGRYGFDVGTKHTEPVGYAANRNLAFDTAPPSPGGPIEVNTKQDLAKARWFIWCYCVSNALKDPDFIRLFYGYGFTRLKIVRDLKHEFGSEDVPLSRLLKTQLAQALVLDWHINSPFNAIKGWANAAVGVDGMAFNKNIDWNTFGSEREYKIIGKIVQARRAPAAMTDGARRGAFIVACASGLSYPGKGSPYNPATFNTWANQHDTFLKKIGFPGGALQLLWEMNHDNSSPWPPPPGFTPTPTQMTTWTRVLVHTYDFLQHTRPS